MKQAADALPVRARAIAVHNDRIMSDMGLKTSADLLRLAIKEGLMQG
jgi:DNA-binding NarL/FixJ family response regulator